MHNPAKFDRCVAAVERRGGPVNPYAICTAGLAGLLDDLYSQTPPTYPEQPPRLTRGSGSALDEALNLPLWSGSAAQQRLAAYTNLQTLTAPRLAAPAGQDWGALLDAYKWPLAGVVLLAVVALRGRR